MKLAHFPIIGMFLLSLLAKINDRGRITLCYTLEYSLFIVLLFAITSLIYVWDMAKFRDMFRGYEKLAYQGLTVVIAASAFYLFGRNSVLYTFYGYALFNLGAVFLAMKNTGLSASVKDFIYFLTSGGDAVGFMKYLELHDLTFSIGLCLIFFLVEGVRKYKAETIIGSIFFFTGFKRIGIIAIIVVFFLWLALRKKCENRIRRAGMVTGIIFLCLGFTYILCTYFRIFELVMTLLEVDTMGRNELYEFIRDYYTIGPFFPGHGFEYVTQLMKTATYGTLNMARIGAIHNGYLTVYIELGFFGFFFWEWFWLLHHMRWQAAYGREALLLYILVAVYLHITYYTDNTAFYYFTGLTWKLIPMAV